MLRFKVGDKTYEFQDDRVEDIKRHSEETGKELSDYRVEIKLEGEQEVNGFEQDIDEPIFKLDENENVIGRYRGQIISSSTSEKIAQETITNYTIRLSEEETDQA